MENSEPAVPARDEAVPVVPQPEPATPGAAAPQPNATVQAAKVVEGASSQIEVPAKLIDQVIGQERAVEVIRKAAIQRRHVMMIGSPGTGKSMLAKAMAELLPKEDLLDILVYPNSDDSNNPIIRTVAAGGASRSLPPTRPKPRKRSSSGTPSC